MGESSVSLRKGMLWLEVAKFSLGVAQGVSREMLFAISTPEWCGTVEETLGMYRYPRYRDVFCATVNAIARMASIVDRSKHCVKELAELCSCELAKQATVYGSTRRVLRIGFQLLHVENLYLLVTDLNIDNVWKVKHGVLIYDG